MCCHDDPRTKLPINGRRGNLTKERGHDWTCEFFGQNKHEGQQAHADQFDFAFPVRSGADLLRRAADHGVDMFHETADFIACRLTMQDCEFTFTDIGQNPSGNPGGQGHIDGQNQ